MLDLLREYLIAGDVNTPRESNLGNARRFAEGDPAYQFGLWPLRPWTYEEVVALMAERVGIDPDLSRTTGPDTIDPELTAKALERMRERLAHAAAGRERVLVATGHPAGVLEIHLAIAAALRAAGCTLLMPAPGVRFTLLDGYRDERPSLQIRYLGGVATCSDGGGLRHSHTSGGIQTMLTALATAGEAPPDLVVADHGFAGGAAAAGLDVVGFADSNDPALFVGEAEGRVSVTVPLDDNVQPHLYAPVVDCLLAGWAASPHLQRS
jgi:hypothetical protein